VSVSSPIAIPLEASYELCLGDSLELSVLQGSDVYPSTYRWDDGYFMPVRSFNRSGVHTVEVYNVCDTAFHIMEVQQIVCGCQIYVPTAFTPNNDGKNDAWFPVLDCDPFTYSVVVWDRWGRPVFSSDDPNEVWYGQVEGTEGSKTRESGDYYAVDGSYMWEIIIELRKDRVPEVLRQNGVVHILR
jgi:gliding motility-associated-like protein